jgi:hypothetical protein
MPYRVANKGGARPWKIIRTDTGQVVGSSASKAAAMASMRARYAAEPKAGKRRK